MNSNVITAVLEYLRITKLKRLLAQMLVLGMLGIILSVCYVVAFHFTSLLSIYTEAHDIRNFGNNLHGNMKADSKMEELLTTTMKTTQANRAYVYRYHNGLASINSVPFYFQSMMLEVISPGTPRVILYEQRLPSGMTPAISAAFVNNKCFTAQGLERPDHSLHFMFQTHGAHAVIRCPVYMPNGDLFGFVGVEFNSSTDSVLANQRQIVENTSSTIAAMYAQLKRN